VSVLVRAVPFSSSREKSPTARSARLPSGEPIRAESNHYFGDPPITPRLLTGRIRMPASPSDPDLRDPYHFGGQHGRCRPFIRPFLQSASPDAWRGEERSHSAFPALVLIWITLQRWGTAGALMRLGSHRPAYGVSRLGAVARVAAMFTVRRPGPVAGCASGSLPHRPVRFPRS
jgi:hypothetical protein